MTANSDPEQSRRRARRAFIRSHHPDAGGDHAGFVAGLAELDAGAGDGAGADARAGAGAGLTPSRPEVPKTQDVDQPWPVSITTSLLRRARRGKRPGR